MCPEIRRILSLINLKISALAVSPILAMDLIKARLSRRKRNVSKDQLDLQLLYVLYGGQLQILEFQPKFAGFELRKYAPLSVLGSGELRRPKAAALSLSQVGCFPTGSCVGTIKDRF